MSDENLYDVFEVMLSELLSEIPNDDPKSDQKIEAICQLVVANGAAYCKEIFSIAKSKNLKAIRNDTRKFEKRNQNRWAPAIDHLEGLYNWAIEICDVHHQYLVDVEGRNSAINNPMNQVLGHVVGKGLVAVGEIIVLIKAGYADGAFARWRSLHELAVTAQYVAKSGETEANLYLASFAFQARRALRQTIELSGIEQVPDSEKSEADAHCETAQILIGRKIANDRDGEWPKIAGFNSFYDLEKSLKLDLFRPVYKLASSYIHSGPQDLQSFLGNQESQTPTMLVGPSSSGMVVPLVYTSLSLVYLISSLLSRHQKVDFNILTLAFSELAFEMNALAEDVEAETMRKHLEKQGA